MVDACVQIFAKAPVPGEVKTRLIPALGEEGAAQLHRRLTYRLLSRLDGVAVDLQLYCAPDCGAEFFVQCAERHALSLYPQGEGDLGDRLYRGLEQGLRQRCFAIAIGTDIPDIDQAMIEAALEGLRAGEDAVFAPAEDGGYGLIALSRIDRHLFDGIHWGGEQVMAQTRARLRELGWRWRELSPCWDLDRPADLERLRELEPPLLEGL